MRFFEPIARLAGPPTGRAERRTARWTGGAIAVLGAGLVVGLHLLLTAIRHEALHIVGGLLTGGLITRVEWLPGPWTLGLVEVTPPLGATPAAFYVPLLLPYVADLILIAIGIELGRRLRPSSIAKPLIVQHMVYFAALDLLVNCAAAYIWPNDWALILKDWGVLRHAMLGSIIAACLAAIATGRRLSSGDGAAERTSWSIPAQAHGAGGRS